MDSQIILQVIDRLSEKAKDGGMNREDILELLDEVRIWYIRENERQILQLHQERSESSRAEDDLYDYIRHNIRQCADILGYCDKTIYRKLKKHSFTLVERKTLETGLKAAM